MKARFDRQEYLALEEIFEVGQLDDVTKELCEFSDDIEDMAYELAYTRYALAKCEARHNALVEAVGKVVEMHRKGEGHVCTHYPSGRRALETLAALVGEE